MEPEFESDARPGELPHSSAGSGLDACAAASAADASQDAPPESFEQALQELVQLVARMEESELTLEESLRAFERGIALTRHCQTALDTAEQTVEILSGKSVKVFNSGDDSELQS